MLKDSFSQTASQHWSGADPWFKLRTSESRAQPNDGKRVRRQIVQVTTVLSLNPEVGGISVALRSAGASCRQFIPATAWFGGGKKKDKERDGRS
ncbi:hypothetical protein PoB_006718500 [Plakobranchus ocellatus]|uniref:Uncharacterized protein n=1 Tax=Plakobranchus ocellatus TaxID=259542 RepID=A0AAV4D9M5_9GAST|nr:hypothetical protein PoB_006718500 [Plakobranchus ocellatus]